jgi:formate/nitrite transporter FocA (FNT family)
MHDEQLNRDNVSQSAIDPLDQRIVRGLETAPELQVPADFAARVASRLPARRPVSLTPTYYGKNAMLAGIAVTLAALVVLALHSTGDAAFGVLESLLFAQFIAFALWLTVWRYGLR